MTKEKSPIDVFCSVNVPLTKLISVELHSCGGTFQSLVPYNAKRCNGFTCPTESLSSSRSYRVELEIYAFNVTETF